MIVHTELVRACSHRHRLGLFAAAVAGFLDLAPAKAGDLPPIVFVSRKLAAEAVPAERAAAIERALSGSLLVREANGSIRALVDSVANPGAGLPVDVMDPDVSYDAARIVFAGYSSAEQGFRIYEVNAATGGGLRQITHTGPELDLARYGEAADLLKGHDDLDPCYLPDGRICFVSTRYPGVAPDARLRATNLYVVNADGTDLHRITTERFGADTPAVDPRTGQIVYSRWWRNAQSGVDPSTKPADPVPPGSPGYGDGGFELTEVPLRGIEAASFPGVNSWFLASVDPDGTDLAMFTGFRLDRNQTQAYRPSFLASGDVLALFLPRTPFIGRPRGDGLRLYRKGPSSPTALGGPQEFEEWLIFQGDQILPFPPAAEPIYAGASGLPDGRLLVSAALPDAERDYGLYLQPQGTGPLSVLYNRAGSAEMDAVAVLVRPLPPQIPDHPVDHMADVAPRTVAEAFELGGSFTFSVENIFFNAPVGVPIVNAPPAGKKLFIEFYAAPQLASRTTADPPLLIERKEVPEDGKIEATLPAGVPLFEVLRRPDGTLAQGRDGQIFHVGGMNFGRAGETNRCVGCHMGHSQMAVPEDATWTNLAPSAFVIASSQLSNMPGAADPAIPPPFFFGGSLPFRAANVVDRKLDPGAGEWASHPQDEGEVSVALNWSTSLLAREVVVYGSASSKALIFGKDHDQKVQALTIRALRAGVVRQEVLVRQVIRPEGTRVPLDSGIEFDTLEVRIQRQDVVGSYEIDLSIALAEVEVIARAVGGPRTRFLRGDTDCNQMVDLTDVIVILSNQYLGVPAVMCCGEAADVNADDVLDISDPISILGFLFIGGPPPSAPFPLCGIPAKSKGDCAVDTCF